MSNDKEYEDHCEAMMHCSHYDDGKRCCFCGATKFVGKVKLFNSGGYQPKPKAEGSTHK